MTTRDRVGDLPYPHPTSKAVTAVMKGNRKTGSSPEVALRSALHRLGLRFRKNYAICIDGRLIRPDIVFVRVRVAVFVDGCFWHRCPEHGTTPRANTAYWGPKLERNVRRDRENDVALRAAGWTSIRVWEHASGDAAVGKVSDVVLRALAPGHHT